jgi:hypothetical protein
LYMISSIGWFNAKVQSKFGWLSNLPSLGARVSKAVSGALKYAF